MAGNDEQYIKMTETPVHKLVVTLAVPTVISMMVTSIYNLVDTAFVGKLGTSASGAVGIVFSLMALIQAIGFMFGQGAGSIVSRLLGKRDVKEASKIVSTAFIFAFGIGVVIMVAGYAFSDKLVYLLGSTETIAPYAKSYMMYILAACPFMVSTFVLNNVLRYEGKAALAMIGLLSGAVLNIGGDALFMFGLNMGIAGAGLATALGQFVSFAILLSIFMAGKTQSKMAVANVNAKASVVANICTTGMPSLLRQGLVSVSTMVLNYQAANYGDEAVAAMSIVARVTMFILSVAIGIGQGFQPVSGFNYGAGRYDRVRKAFVFTQVMASALLAVISVAVFLNAADLVQIFRDDPLVIEIGTRALRIQCVALLFMPLGMITEMLLQSTGKKAGASVLSSLRSGLFFIPILLILSKVRGLSGIQEAQPIAYVLAAFPAIFYIGWFFRNLPKENGDGK